MMTVRTSLSLLLSFALAGSVAAYAQQGDPQQQTPAPVMRAHHQHSPEHETRKLTRKLGLTPDQAAQVEPILAARQDQMNALKANPPADARAMHQQMRAISHESREKLNAVLTDQQRQEFAAMRKHHRQQQGQAAPPTAQG